MILTRFSTAGGQQGSQEETIISTTSFKSRKLHEFRYWKEEDVTLMDKLHEEHKKSMKKYPVKKMLFSEVEEYLQDPSKCKHKIYAKSDKKVP